MNNKWHQFHSQYSPIDAGSVSEGSSRVEADWLRLSSEDAAVNGLPVSSHKAKYNFSTPEEVKRFLKDEILKDLKPELDKETIANYLLRTFHQGGFMYPVSAPLPEMINREIHLQPHAPTMNRQIRIMTTETGFKVQEISTIKRLAPGLTLDGCPESLQRQLDSSENGYINPDEGSEFVIKAGASIAVDFSASPDKPKVTVESNYISYGNTAVAEALDKRSLLGIIVDWFRNILGLNVVEQPAIKEPPKSDEVPSLSPGV